MRTFGGLPYPTFEKPWPGVRQPTEKLSWYSIKVLYGLPGLVEYHFAGLKSGQTTSQGL